MMGCAIVVVRVVVCGLGGPTHAINAMLVQRGAHGACAVLPLMLGGPFSSKGPLSVQVPLPFRGVWRWGLGGKRLGFFAARHSCCPVLLACLAAPLGWRLG